MLPIARGAGGVKLGHRSFGPDGRPLRRSARRRLCTCAWALGALILPTAAIVFISHGTPFLARALVGTSGEQLPQHDRRADGDQHVSGQGGSAEQRGLVQNGDVQPTPVVDPHQGVSLQECAAAVEGWLAEEATRQEARARAKPMDLTFFLHVPRTAGRRAAPLKTLQILCVCRCCAVLHAPHFHRSSWRNTPHNIVRRRLLRAMHSTHNSQPVFCQIKPLYILFEFTWPPQKQVPLVTLPSSHLKVNPTLPFPRRHACPHHSFFSPSPSPPSPPDNCAILLAWQDHVLLPAEAGRASQPPLRALLRPPAPGPARSRVQPPLNSRRLPVCPMPAPFLALSDPPRLA